MPNKLYVILGVSRDVNLDKIDRAYRRLAHRYRSPAPRGEIPPPPGEAAREAELEPTEPSPPGPVVAPPPRPRRWPGFHLDQMPDAYGAIDEYYQGWVPGLYTTGRQRARQKDLYVEIILDRDEAAQGGTYPLEVPVKQICPACGGVGRHGLITCPHCEGGTIDHHEIQLAVPPGVESGQRAQLSLEEMGLPDVRLNVLVTVR